MIDRIRTELQQRLDQLLAEADKLRRALAALDPRAGASSTQPETPRPAPPAATRQRVPEATHPQRRTPPGATKARVLAALGDGKAMTAGEVAQATSLARPTVSTTLSKLSKSGEVLKAKRGYRLPASSHVDSTPERSDGT